MSRSRPLAVSPRRCARAGRRFSKSMSATKILSCREISISPSSPFTGRLAKTASSNRFWKIAVCLTGDGVKESWTAFDKIESKRKFEAAGVTTPRWQVIGANEKPTLPVPLVIKAPRQGSTVGVYIIKEAGKLETGLAEARKFDRQLLVEEFVPGRELTIGILGDQVLPILEIIPKGGFYDFTNKYPFLNPQAGGGAEHVCPAKIDHDKTKEIQDLALKAHRAIGLQVYSRVDVLLPENGAATVLEVNTIPGMTEASLLPEAAAAAGINYADLCRRIIDLSRARTESSGR